MRGVVVAGVMVAALGGARAAEPTAEQCRALKDGIAYETQQLANMQQIGMQVYLAASGSDTDQATRTALKPISDRVMNIMTPDPQDRIEKAIQAMKAMCP